MWYDSLYVLLDLVSQYFVEKFCIDIYQKILACDFPYYSAFGFPMRVMMAPYNEFGSVSSSIFLGQFENILYLDSSLDACICVFYQIWILCKVL